MKWMKILAVATLACTTTAATAPAQPWGPGGNLPLPPGRMKQRLRDEPFTIVSAKRTQAGIMGARKLELFFLDEPRHIEAKWKVAPSRADGWNNSPRREIAAYAVQQLFLDPADQVVPPVVVRCMPLGVYSAVESDPSSTLDGSKCVYGTLSAWLQNVTAPKDLFDRARFSHDVRYATRFANLNLLTYLIENRDSRSGNILVSTVPANPQFFSVDNGIAFGGVLYDFFVSHLDEIRVGSLPKKSIDRLRRVTRRDLDALGVLGQLEVDSAGILRNVEPTANLDPEEGTRLRPGYVQFGLTTEEIDAIADRLHDLLTRVDTGKLAAF